MQNRRFVLMAMNKNNYGMKTIGIAALKSLIGNGLRTWLTVFVLSVAFILILVMQGLMKNWSEQAITDTIKWEIADGQYWHARYDPYDPFSLDSSIAQIPAAFRQAMEKGYVEPLLLTQASINPNGRMMGVQLRGIRPGQQAIAIPTHLLDDAEVQKKFGAIPVVIGSAMAEKSNLKLHDIVTLRWRDKYGAFEARDVCVVEIFRTTVPTVDLGIVWLALDTLQAMTLHQNGANVLLKLPESPVQELPHWTYKSVETLTESTTKMVKTKSAGTSVFYLVFLLLAMLAIFDTQTLSIFRRQREIGTLIAMGMTQGQVQWMFTLEGTLNAVLAFALGALWGTPLIWYLSHHGISFNMNASDLGVSMADRLYTTISVELILSTMCTLLIITAAVSFLPARKISKMIPTDAIRGKTI